MIVNHGIQNVKQLWQTEYMATSNACQEVIWLKKLFVELMQEESNTQQYVSIYGDVIQNDFFQFVTYYFLGFCP